MKLFQKYKQYTKSDGIVVTKFKPNVDMTIQSINLDTGDVEDKAILEYSKHENLRMYSISSSVNLFEEFWVSENHSLIVFDHNVRKYIKIGPLIILEEPSRYSLVRGADKVHISCSGVDIALALSKTVGYDFTVADNFTFCTHDGIFIQDTMAAHLPVSKQSLLDVKQLMDGNKHLLNPGNSSVATVPSHEMLIGLYKLTNLVDMGLPKKYKSIELLNYLQQINEVKVNEKILFSDGNGSYKETCLGRLWLEELLQVSIDAPLEKKSIQASLSKVYDKLTIEQFTIVLNKLKELGFEWATKLNFSLGMNDFYIPSTRENKFLEASQYAEEIESGDFSETQKHELVVRRWMNTIKEVQDDFITEAGEDNSLVLMYRTGARASMSQISQLTVAKGMQADSAGNIHRYPIERNHREGLDVMGYFRSMSGSRKGLVDSKFSTPKTGYLTRRMVMAARDFYIVSNNCRTQNGFWVPNSSIKGRSVIESSDGWSKIRSPIFCEAKGGLCKKCYGIDPATRKKVAKNTAVGVIAGQSLSEPTTQMTLRTFHTSGAAELGDSPTVVISSVSGTVHIETGDVTAVFVDTKVYYAHSNSTIVVEEGQKVVPGIPLINYVKDVRQEDVTNKVPILELYFEVRVPKVEAVVSMSSGPVTLNPTNEGTVEIFIDDVLQGTVVDQPVFVYDGQIVNRGQFLSYGEVNLRKLWNTTGDLELMSSVFVSRLAALYLDEGVKIFSIHLEVIFRALTEIVRKEDGSLGLRMFEDGDILLKGADQLGGNHPSWLKAVGYGWTKSNLSLAAAMNKTSYDLPTERIMVGELLPRRSQDFA